MNPSPRCDNISPRYDLPFAEVEKLSFDSSIPVVDLNDLSITTLRDALKTVGFVAIQNSGIDSSKLDAGYDKIIEFFRQDKELKLSICDPQNHGQRGYVESEIAVGQNKKDFKEHIHIGANGNLWPKGFDMEAPTMDLYREMMDASIAVGKALSLAMDEQESFLPDLFAGGENLMRAIHYPSNCEDGTIWAAQHTDIDLFTILPKSTADGLEVLNADGEWVPVRVPENSIIVNVGDMLQNLTNGEFRSSVHRVKDPGKGEERFSIVFFIHPKGETDLAPLAKYGTPLYPVATRNELLFERLANLESCGKEMLKFLADSGIVERQLQLGQASEKVMKLMRDNQLASPAILAALTPPSFDRA